MASPGERQARKEEENRREIYRTTPACCPRCGIGMEQLSLHLVKWFAHSLDSQDLHNTAVLNEHQCLACAISFWM